MPTAKPRKRNKPLLFAHRGGNLVGLGKENTMAAFRACVQSGVDHIETDVVLSSDGQVVIYHGSANRLKQIQTSQVLRSKVQMLSYEQIHSTIKPGGEKVPLLRDVLNEFPEVFFSIDAKTDEVVTPLLRLIKAQEAENRVSVTSFNLRRSRQIAQSLGEMTGICIDRHQAAAFRLFARARLKKIRSGGIKVIHFPHTYINKSLVKLAQQNGLELWAWTVNKPSDMKKMVELGADGIISDEIKALKATISGL